MVAIQGRCCKSIPIERKNNIIYCTCPQPNSLLAGAYISGCICNSPGSGNFTCNNLTIYNSRAGQIGIEIREIEINVCEIGAILNPTRISNRIRNKAVCTGHIHIRTIEPGFEFIPDHYRAPALIAASQVGRYNHEGVPGIVAIDQGVQLQALHGGDVYQDSARTVRIRIIVEHRSRRNGSLSRHIEDDRRILPASQFTLRLNGGGETNKTK